VSQLEVGNRITNSWIIIEPKNLLRALQSQKQFHYDTEALFAFDHIECRAEVMYEVDGSLTQIKAVVTYY
jgi:hypothetical protein